MLIKVLAFAVIIWFYKSGKQQGENGIQWALLGLLGYAITVAIGIFGIAKPILASFHTPPMTLYLLLNHILPPVLGLIVAYFANKKLKSRAALGAK